MQRLNDIYFAIKELFGPKIKIEIINTSNINDLKHVTGENILKQIQERKKLSKDELNNILKDDFGELTDFHMQALSNINPMDILLNGIQVEEWMLVNLSQFKSFSRVVNINYKDNRYSIILSTPLFESQRNQNNLTRFWKVVEDNIHTNKDLILEYLKADLPQFMSSKVESLLKIIRGISMLKIENKEINTGLIFVEDYLTFKQDLYSDLFLDLTETIDVRELDRIKQPFLEIAHGDNGFLVIDDKFCLKGVMYPDNTISGLILNNPSGKHIHNSLTVKILGTNTVRVVLNNQIIFEIINGQIRKKDYLSFSDILFGSLRDIGITDDFYTKIRNNIMDIANFGKGTIIVIGDQLPEDKSNGGISSEINIIDRFNKYRNYILDQISSTDGAVLVNKELKIYKFGTILKLLNPGRTESTGGSRSYSAEQFSRENPNHLVIKISEDGPVALYQNGEYLIEI